MYNQSRRMSSVPKDNILHGKLQEHVDRRIAPDCNIIDWRKNVRYVPDYYHKKKLVSYIPLEDAEQIINENEELRQTLYLTQATSKSYEFIMSASKDSTSKVNKAVRQLSSLTNNSLTEKDIYVFIYDTLSIFYSVNFSRCPPQKSKLQWLWEEGYLPIINLLVQLLRAIIIRQQQYAPKEFADLAKAINKHNKNRVTITNKVKSPF